MGADSLGFRLLLPSKHSRINKISQRFWMYGIISSLVSSVASLVRLRAEGRRLALSRSISSSSEKGGPEGGDEGQRREEGKRLLT
jgi:peroxin-11B